MAKATPRAPRYRVKGADYPGDYTRNWLVTSDTSEADGVAVAAAFSRRIARLIARALNTALNTAQRPHDD